MIILGTNSIKDTGYDVANSCRFNSASNDHLNRTQTAGNRRKFTFSTWVKRCNPATRMALFLANRSGSNYDQFFLHEDGILEADFYHSGTQIFRYKTNALYRDPSAWYHIIMAVDTEHDTASSRVRIYVNGLEVTSFSTETNPSENVDTHVNENSIVAYIGSDYNSNEPDYYLAETVMLDGTQATPTDFGEFDEDSGIWKPIDVSGLTFGTNGFYLDYKDSSALGNDVSGNNNDFTANNLTAADQSTDTCTNNWCVQNSIATPISGSPTFSQGNLTIASGSGWKSTIGTFALTKGLWYWETKGGGSAGTILNGIASTAVIEAGGASNGVNNNATIGVNLPAYAYHGSSGAMYRSDTTGNGLDQGGGSWGTAYNTGDLISVYLDLDNYKLYTAKNNTLNVSGTGYSIASGYAYYPLCVPYTNTINLNYGIGAFGATAVSSGVADANGFGSFEYDPSRGGSSDFDSTAKDFLAICTKNLAEYG